MRAKTETGLETGSTPKTRTVPASARNKPKMCLINVVLPAPFSPTSPNTLPRGRYSDTSFNTVFEPNVRDRFVMATTASAEEPKDCRSACASIIQSRILSSIAYQFAGVQARFPLTCESHLALVQM